MELFLIAWIMIGFLHWCDYMINYCFRPCAQDFILGLPFFMLAGGLTTVRKLMN